FSQAHETRAHEYLEYIAQSELLDTECIQCARLIVNRAHPEFPRRCQRARDREGIGLRLGTRVHELLELIPRKWPFPIEHRLFQVLMEANLAVFERRHDRRMPSLEVGAI